MNQHSLETAANQLHEATSKLLLNLWDADEDRHPETGQMYSSCAQAWLAINHYRQQTGAYGGRISPEIYEDAQKALNEQGW